VAIAAPQNARSVEIIVLAPSASTDSAGWGLYSENRN